MERTIAMSLAMFFSVAPAVGAAPKRPHAPERCWIDAVKFDPGAPGVVVYGTGQKPVWSNGPGAKNRPYVDLMGEGGVAAILREDHAHFIQVRHPVVKQVFFGPHRQGVVRIVVEGASPLRLGKNFKTDGDGWILRLPLIRGDKKLPEPGTHEASMPRKVKTVGEIKLPKPPRVRIRRALNGAATLRFPIIPLEPFMPIVVPPAGAVIAPLNALASAPVATPDAPAREMLLDASPRIQLVPYRGDSPAVRISRGLDGQIRVRLEGVQSVPPRIRPAGVARIERSNGEIVVSFMPEIATTSVQPDTSLK